MNNAFKNASCFRLWRPSRKWEKYSFAMLLFFAFASPVDLYSWELSSTSMVKQEQKLQGKVTDSQGEPIIGANVVVKGTSNGTITDYNGFYSLSVPDDAVIVVTYVGYKQQEISVKGRLNLNIVLKEDNELLEEVVVIGYGVQKKADLTGAVANVKTDKLNTQSNLSISQALQGKIAGVDIVSMGGKPGAGTKIMVRGIGTLNNASPLYIVDGMYLNSIDNINPNDIESIDVLKDASSAAIYGSRAANGVIILTTKSGKDSEGKPIIDLAANVGVNTPSKYLDLLNAAQWAEISTISRKNAGMEPLDMAVDVANKPDNDWQDIMMGPALIQNYNLSIKGGNKHVNYYNSIGYSNHDGTMKGTDYERYTFQSKIDFSKGMFKAGSNVILSYDDNTPMHAEVRGGFVGHTLMAIPTLEKYDSDNVGGYGGTYGDVLNLKHPLGIIDENLFKRFDTHTQIFANMYFSVEPIKGLKYKLSFSPDFQFGRNGAFTGEFDFGLSANGKNTMSETQNRNRNILIEHLLSFDKTFGNHKISAILGYSYQDSRARNLYGAGDELPEGVYELDAATTGKTSGGNYNRSVLTSIFSRIFYSYKNRYLITASIRRDGSSKFAPDNRYAIFPSFSLGWNIAEENFMRNTRTWLDQLKIRGGYGVLGNQEIGNYQYIPTVTTGMHYPDGKGGLLMGAIPKYFSNPDIKWEETTSTNIGLDFVGLNNRLSFTADWYVKDTKDILLTVPIPISTGAANDPVRNAGKIQNKGFEFNIGWNDYVNQDLSYGVNFIGTFNKNKVVSMGTESQNIASGIVQGGTYTTKTIAGYPIGGFWLIPCDGYFNSEEEVQQYAKNGQLIQPVAKPGDIRFKDMNDDGAINDDDRVYCGSPFPKFTYSINGNITYKQFDVMLGFQGVAGNKIYNASRLWLEDVTKGSNYLATTLDYWTPENHDASVPRLTWNDTNRNSRSESDRYLEKGDYFRLKTLQLGYSLPDKVLRGIIQKVRVYMNIENLFTITSYSGYSPDVNTTDVYSRGFDEFMYPSNRTYMFGVNVTF